LTVTVAQRTIVEDGKDEERGREADHEIRSRSGCGKTADAQAPIGKSGEIRRSARCRSAEKETGDVDRAGEEDVFGGESRDREAQACEQEASQGSGEGVVRNMPSAAGAGGAEVMRDVR